VDVVPEPAPRLPFAAGLLVLAGMLALRSKLGGRPARAAR